MIFYGKMFIVHKYLSFCSLLCANSILPEICMNFYFPFSVAHDRITHHKVHKVV